MVFLLDTLTHGVYLQESKDMAQHFGLNHKVSTLTEPLWIDYPKQLGNGRLYGAFGTCHSCDQVIHDLVELVTDKIGSRLLTLSHGL